MPPQAGVLGVRIYPESLFVVDKTVRDKCVCLNMLYLGELDWETKWIAAFGLLNLIEIKS